MPFNGSGGFTRVRSWVSDAAANIKIRADYHDSEDDNLASGLSNAICKDGQTQITANIPLNGFKLTNVGTPSNNTDAANKAYVDGVKTFTTGIDISGADANGRVTFSSPTGTNGLCFVGADLSWLAKLADGSATPPTINRLVLNDKADGTGADVVVLQDEGSVQIAGTMTSAAGVFQSSSASVMLAATGSGTVYLRPWGAASGSGQTTVDSTGHMIVSGDITSGGSIGATTDLTAGGNILVNGGITTHGGISADGNIGTSGSITCGSAVTAHDFITLDNSGLVYGNLVNKFGKSGGFSSTVATMYWNGTGMALFVDNSNLGTINTTSDYRIKKDIQPLASTWDRVKTLRPCSYSFRDFGDLFKASDEVQWGFLAHEVQEDLIQSAAGGRKDEENVIQNLNLMAVVSALTKALQEAMARIEALEAAA